jgi:hypothetical protein
MDLISRKAAIEYLMTNMGWTDEDGYAVDDADEKRAHIEDLINGVPAVPAVPLDKLSTWITENLDPRYHDCEHCSEENACYDCPMMTEQQVKEKLEKWMEKQDEQIGHTELGVVIAKNDRI